MTSDDSTLYEKVLNNFSRTPSGKVYEKNLKELYSMIIINLDLKRPQGTKMRLNPLSKSYPYSFTEEDALQVMKNLQIDMECSKTTTTISYSIKPELGHLLLKIFFQAKLIHSPSDRTRGDVDSRCLLQPTPKGIAIVHDFYEKSGNRKEAIPSILLSNLNSMDLLVFERHSVSDKILYSDSLIEQLFVWMLGESPNIWTPKKKPETLKTFETRMNSLECFSKNAASVMSDGILVQDLTQRKHFDSFYKNPENSHKHHEREPEDEKRSFLHHRFFTNPESDAHVQYYVSTSGIRLHKSTIFRTMEKKEEQVPMCLSGKSIYQWIFDCSDVFTSNDAVQICNLFLKAKLIIPILHPPSVSCYEYFKNERNAFYIVSAYGLRICHWQLFPENVTEVYSRITNGSFDPQSSRSGILERGKNITLQNILKDPGMRLLFRKHLENELCFENFDAYMRLKEFSKKIGMLSKLLGWRKETDSDHSKNANGYISQLIDECMSVAYSIYFTYITSDSPFSLNIDFNLQQGITAIMIPKSYMHVDVYDYLETPKAETPNETLKRSNSKKSDSKSWKDNSFNSSKQSLLSSDPSEVFGSERYCYDTIEDKDQENITPQYATCRQSCQKSLITPVSGKGIDSLEFLVKISSMFNLIARHTYRLMEVDSFPKFLNSEILQNAINSSKCKLLA